MKLNTKSILGIILFVAFLPFVLKTCTNSITNHAIQGDGYKRYTANYEGEFCADINYFNPKTGTESEYTLLVVVEEDLLIEIKWPNGGWLDTTYFDPVDISTGIASFTTYDGNQYEIKLLNDQQCDLSVNFNDFALQVLTPMEYYRVSKLGITEDERVNVYQASFKIDSLLRVAFNVFISGGYVRATMNQEGAYSGYHNIAVIQKHEKYYVLYGRGGAKVEVGTFAEGFDTRSKKSQSLIFWQKFDEIEGNIGVNMTLLYESNSWDKAFDFAGNKYNDVFFEVMALKERLK